MYQVTEGPLLGPSSELMICVTIDFGSLGRDVSVNLVTPITGSSVIGKTELMYKKGVFLCEGRQRK